MHEKWTFPLPLFVVSSANNFGDELGEVYIAGSVMKELGTLPMRHGQQ